MQNIGHLSGHIYSQVISAVYHLQLIGLGPKDRLASNVRTVAKLEKMSWAHHFFFFVSGFRLNKCIQNFL